MAGIRFWPEMRSLSRNCCSISTYKQVVPVFTNVIFDTSQIHANVMFENMFACGSGAGNHPRPPGTFFIIRAHPDEDRPGKQSRESVADWVERNQVERLSNALFVAPREYFSSYEFIQRSKFVMVYNSTIGLEAAIMGAAVLCGGKARFTQIPTVFLPDSSAAHRSKAEELLSADKIAIPPEFQRNARNFLYYQLFKTSLPFDDLLTRDITPGFVCFGKGVTWQDFTPQRSASIRALVDGLLFDGDFLREDD